MHRYPSFGLVPWDNGIDRNELTATGGYLDNYYSLAQYFQFDRVQSLFAMQTVASLRDMLRATTFV